MRFAIAMLSGAMSILLLNPAYAAEHGHRSESAKGCEVKGTSARKDIVDTAVGAGDFKTLVAAVKAAGLVETLKGDGPFTVFAPTDEAFRKVNRGALQSLLRPENREKLTALLTYHVVPGKLTAEDVSALNGAKTVNGTLVKFRAHGSDVQINQASVLKANLETSNGIIHVIDSVLMP
jgi:transforming growth factor-beta-induced protein